MAQTPAISCIAKLRVEAEMKSFISPALLVVLVAAGLAALAAFARVSAQPDPALHHVFRLNGLCEPLSVVSVVMERDGGTLVVGLRGADGKEDGCEFNYKMNEDHGPKSAYGRLYADEWLVPLGSPIQDKVARAVRHYVAGPGRKDRLAGYLLFDVNYLEKLRNSAAPASAGTSH